MGSEMCIRDRYRPATGEVWLTPYATEETIRHEIAHAVFCREHPELCERAKTSREVAVEVERRVRELEGKIKLDEDPLVFVLPVVFPTRVV